MAAIDEISRQVLIMKYALGMPYKETGIRLNIPAENIGSRSKVFSGKERGS